MLLPFFLHIHIHSIFIAHQATMAYEMSIPDVIGSRSNRNLQDTVSFAHWKTLQRRTTR
jgi:hypothetical protein